MFENPFLSLEVRQVHLSPCSPVRNNEEYSPASHLSPLTDHHHDCCPQEEF